MNLPIMQEQATGYGSYYYGCCTDCCGCLCLAECPLEDEAEARITFLSTTKANPSQLLHQPSTTTTTNPISPRKSFVTSFTTALNNNYHKSNIARKSFVYLLHNNRSTTTTANPILPDGFTVKMSTTDNICTVRHNTSGNSDL
jgi:hypothetical protein